MPDRITHTPTQVTTIVQGERKLKLCPKCGMTSDWMLGQVCDGRDVRLRIPHVDEMLEHHLQSIAMGTDVEFNPVE